MNLLKWIYCCCLFLVTFRGSNSLAPLALRLRTKLTELSMNTLGLTVGSKVSITCDGSSSDLEDDPKLSWYSPDKFLIDNEDFHERIFTKVSKSKKYRKLIIKDAHESDAGEYVCLGWHRFKARWDIIKITLVVGQDATGDNDASNQTYTAMTSDAASLQSSTRRTTLLTKYTVIGSSTDADCFICNDGQCINPALRCDNFPDCADGSDEAACTTTVCIEDETPCKDGSMCVSAAEICDGFADCPDKSDEATCTSP